ACIALEGLSSIQLFADMSGLSIDYGRPHLGKPQRHPRSFVSWMPMVPPVSMNTFMNAFTVSSRFQSRCSSHKSCVKLIILPPACSMRRSVCIDSFLPYLVLPIGSSFLFVTHQST